MRCECGGRKQADRQGAVLFAALDDIAGLDEDLGVLRHVLDGQLVDVLGFVDDDFLLLQCLVEREESAILERILAVNQKDGQVALCVGAGKPIGRFGGFGWLGGLGRLGCQQKTQTDRQCGRQLKSVARHA